MVQLHQRIPFGGARGSELTRNSHQNAPQDTRQVLATFRVTSQPKEVVGRAARQSVPSPRFRATGSVARRRSSRVHRPVGKHPGIFTAPAPLHGDDLRVHGG